MEYSSYFMMFIGATNIMLVVFLLKVTARQREMNERYTQQIKLLSADVSALCAGAASSSGYLNKVEQKVKRVLERQDQLDQREPSDRALSQASRMARQGASVEEMIATCGLVRAEAELLMLLHRAQKEEEGSGPLRVVSG